MRSNLKYGAAIPVTLAVVTSIGGVFAAGYGGLSFYHAKINSFAKATLPTALDLELLIRSSGISPEGLAAAGVSARNTTSVVSRGIDYIIPNFDVISVAQLEHANATKVHGNLVKFVRSGQADKAQVVQLDQARERLDAAVVAQEAWLNAIYSECVDGLTTQQSTTLGSLNDNSTWDAPMQYRAAARSQEDWTKLRKALANVRIAGKLGETPDSVASQLIAEVNANAKVSAAKTSLNNLPFIQTSWDAAINK